MLFLLPVFTSFLLVRSLCNKEYCLYLSRRRYRSGIPGLYLQQEEMFVSKGRHTYQDRQVALEDRFRWKAQSDRDFFRTHYLFFSYSFLQHSPSQETVFFLSHKPARQLSQFRFVFRTSFSSSFFLICAFQQRFPCSHGAQLSLPTVICFL